MDCTGLIYILACAIIDVYIHCWIVVFTSIIDGITSPIANIDPATALAAVEETALIPPRGLAEWNGRDIIWYGYPSAKWIKNILLGILFGKDLVFNVLNSCHPALYLNMQWLTFYMYKGPLLLNRTVQCRLI